MKNKINIAFLLFIFIFKLQTSYADEINFDVTKLEIGDQSTRSRKNMS